MRAEGSSEENIAEAVKRGYETGRFKAPRKPGIAYMLSGETYVYSAGARKLLPSMPHLMFYAPYATENDLASPAAAPGMPRVLRAGQADAYFIVFPQVPKR